MPRFRTSLWDVHGYVQETWLDRISNTQIDRELNGQRSFSFTIPINDIIYPLLQTRKIIRLHDTDKESISEFVYAGSGNNLSEKSVLVSSLDTSLTTIFKVGQYIQMYDAPPVLFTSVLPALTPGTNVSIDVSTNSGTVPSVGDFLKITEEIGTEKVHSTGVSYKSSNAEVVEVLSVSGNTITADLAYSYDAGAILSTPGRSFVAKIIGREGDKLVLSRMDFLPAVNSVVNLVDFETFRINEISESREDGIPMATIQCRHITFDLNDILFFKDARMDVSYSTGGSGLRPDNVVTPSVLLDAILARHTKKDGTPVSTKSFIRGDLVQFYYSKGIVTGIGSLVVGTDLADFPNQKFSNGSLIYIDGLDTPRKILSQSGNTLTIDPSFPSTVSNAEYYIMSAGIYASDVSSTTGIDSEVLTPVLGTVTFNTSDKNKLTNASFATTHLATGKIKTGAVVRFQDRPDEEYYISYIYDGADIYLTEELPLSSGSGIKVTIEPDEREVNVTSMDTSLGVLNNLVKTFTDKKQQYYYWVTEDRAINIYRRPESDVSNDRDPTSDLVVMYRNDQNRNLRSINREFDYSDFGNRIIPQGSNSGWSNVSSGIKTGVTDRSIKGVIGTGVTVDSNNRLTDSTLDDDFETQGVLPGMRIIRTHDDDSGSNPLGLISKSTNIIAVTTNQVTLAEDIQIVGSSWQTDDIYEIDFGVTREQYKIPYRDNKLFRLGDPILVHKNKQEFTISDASQVTVTKALISSTPTAGTVNYLDDDTQSFTDAEHKWRLVHKANSSETFIVHNAIPGYDRIELSPSASSAWSTSTPYKMSSTQQFVLNQDGSTYNYSNITQSAFRGGNSGAGVAILEDDNDATFFGSNEKFDYVQFTIVTGGTVTSSGSAVVTWDYVSEAHSVSKVPIRWTTLDLTKNEEETLPSGAANGTGSSNFFTGIKINHQIKWLSPRIWTKSIIDGIEAYWIRITVDMNSWTGVAPNIIDLKNYGWEENKYRGGMVYIESGKASGQSRSILSNDLDTIVIGNRFPNISDIKGSTAIVSEKVGQTHIRGFGYRVLSVSSTSPATDTTVTANTLLLDYAYYNGLLTIKTGAGQGQVFRIMSNKLDANKNTVFTIDGTFNPRPDGQFEVFAQPQMLHNQDIGTVTCGLDTGNAVITGFDGVNWLTNQWEDGIAIITDADDEVHEIRTIEASSSASVQLKESATGGSTITGWVNGTPSNAGCILMKEHSLAMSVVSGLDFEPNHNDDISLVLKMGGGPLTVGKSVNYRTYANFSVRGILNVEDASFFSKGDIIFIGAQDVPTNDYYNVNRGDQVLGHIATIKRVINITDTCTTSTNSTDVDDSAADFVSSGVVRGAMIKNTTSNKYAMANTVSTTNISTTSHWQDPVGSNPVQTDFLNTNGYSIQALVLEDDLVTVPQFGDHVELLGFTDGTSARKNDLIETKFAQSQTNDPTVLYREAKRRLEKLKDIEPRYSVSFVDLYELDPEKYPFDNYALGDTIKIVDEDITGVDGYNLRIIKESFDPALPEDKTHTIEVGKRKRTFLRDDYIPLNLEVSDIRDNVEEMKTSHQSPICAYFDTTTRQCVKEIPPNSFCNIPESNNDGRLTRRKTPITRYHCQSYLPITNSKQAGLDNPLNQSFMVSAKGLTDDAFLDTRTYAIDVPFVLDKDKSKIIVINVENSSNLSAAIPSSVLIAEFKTDSTGDIIPYNPYNSEFGHGGYVQIKKSADDSTEYNADILVTGVGRYNA